MDSFKLGLSATSFLTAFVGVVGCDAGSSSDPASGVDGAAVAAGGSANGSGGSGAGSAAGGGMAAGGSTSAGGSQTGGGGASNGGGAGAQGTGGSQANPGTFGQEIRGGGTANDFEVFPLTIGGVNYNVQTNPWGGANQTITAGGDNVFVVDSISGPGGGNPWDVIAFPSVYVGKDQGGNESSGNPFPLAISDITSIRTGLATNADSANYSGNTTYDVYFTSGSSYNGGAPDVYLMVWFDSNGLNPINSSNEDWSCGGQPPTYVDSCTTKGSMQLGGKTFHRFTGLNGSADVISYVPEAAMGTWEFDLKDFIDDAVAQGVLDTGMFLQSVQAGFEITSGGNGLAVHDFYVDVS